jgi:hypothetical protein
MVREMMKAAGFAREVLFVGKREAKETKGE